MARARVVRIRVVIMRGEVREKLEVLEGEDICATWDGFGDWGVCWGDFPAIVAGGGGEERNGLLGWVEGFVEEFDGYLVGFDER